MCKRQAVQEEDGQMACSSLPPPSCNGSHLPFLQVGTGQPAGHKGCGQVLQGHTLQWGQGRGKGKVQKGGVRGGGAWCGAACLRMVVPFPVPLSVCFPLCFTGQVSPTAPTATV